MFQVILLILISLATWSDERTDQINGVELITSKDESVRTYQGKMTFSFQVSAEEVLKAVINFNEKCNNSFKKKRLFTTREMECEFHNDHLVETKILREFNRSHYPREPHEIDRFLLARRIYNRGFYHHYEMVTIFQLKNHQNQKEFKVVQRLMNDEEIEKSTTPLFKTDSAFNGNMNVFTIKSKGDHSEFTFEYNAYTDHWILNKEISVPQVFNGISKSVNDLIKTIIQKTQKSSEIAKN